MAEPSTAASSAEIDPEGFDALLQRYLDWLEVHHYSESMLKSSRRLVGAFARWCAERSITRPRDVSRTTVERYQRFVYYYRKDNGQPLGFKTQQGRLVSVRSFFRWLVRERYLLYNPAAEIVLPKRPPRLPTDSFTVKEVEQILRVPDIQTALGLRDRAILETLYSTGVRRIELSRLDLYDLDQEREWLTVRRGKGGRGRVVPIGTRALRWLVKYLEEVRPDLVLAADEWALFLSVQGTRLTPGALTNLVRRIIAQSDVQKRRGACHLFRHTMATQMLENGADIRFIQEILGHQNLETTQLYTKVAIQKLKQIHQATHPAKLERAPRDVE